MKFAVTSLRNRILFFFTIFATIALITVYLGGRSLRIVGNAAESVVDHHLPLVNALGQIEVALNKQDSSVYRYLATQRKTWMDVFEREKINYFRWYEEVEKGITSQQEQDVLQEIDELYVQYENMARKIFLSVGRSNNDEIRKMMAQSDQFLSQIMTQISHLGGIRQGITSVQEELIADRLGFHEKASIYFLIAIVLCFILLALYLWQYLVRPLSLLLDGIRDFTRGRLDVQIPSIGKDELGELQDAFNEMAHEIANERKRLKSESQSDPLTGLFNMRYFRIQLADEFSRSQRYSHPLTLLMLDVDHFKAYNDRNGHPAGDIVLKEISRILIRNIRGTDIVARYGGEEFMIMLPETTIEAAEKVAEKIRKAVEVHYFPFQENIATEKLSVSVGVASYPNPTITSDHDLIEATDKALYHAKENGRNRVSVYTKVYQEISHADQLKGRDLQPS